MRRTSALLAIAFVFGAGVLVGTRFPESRDEGTSEEAAAIPSHAPAGATLEPTGAPEHVSDRLQLSQSAAVKTSYASSEALADPRARAALEKSLREVPYAVLKQIFLERQDAQWLRQQERYAQPKEMTDEEIARRADRLFEAYRRNGGENSYYISRGELKLRGGKAYPFVAFVEYYSSRPRESAVPNVGDTVQAEGSEATRGKEMCFGSTLAIRIGDRYASDALSNCLTWVAVRKQAPFVLHANYNSKRLVPIFDTVALALPGFGNDGEVSSEWFDAGAERWASLGNLHWDPVSKDEFVAASKEVELETDD